MTGKAAYVHLIDDGPGGWVLKGFVALPIVRGGIHHHALHRCRTVVTGPPPCFTAVIPRDRHSAAIRVEKDLRAIEPHPVCGIRRSLNSITVDLAGLNCRHEGMPVVISA